MTNPSEFMWKIEVWRYEDVTWLLRKLKFRHPEKTAKSKIALRLGPRPDPLHRADVEREWESLVSHIEIECRDYITSARSAWEGKSLSKRRTRVKQGVV
jgi:hypothetical protein